MSKFLKTKSIKFQNQSGAQLNRIASQHNKEVISLNRTYSIKESNIDDPDKNTKVHIVDQTADIFSFGDMYPDHQQQQLEGSNPNIISLEAINYSTSKLDYLYKKQLFKK
jgi:hypothetical protein